ncbi:MAG: fluoride efflux transporter CrcB [Pseudodesulfovibrio sp.]|uniref:Fluoride-specific ion channel FluC n=1 Tax=Pseudodesulfovibrio aespoeensis (strain ATCC 700646 / DSM 10631 / Aspo-2) TaxID=643562 RepID=E6VZ50_PSEA9|nr:MULTISPECIES: fluoride efflux transporter CrcB [Pseudodesulfovibrio]MBU4191847.1 fluoride efflux transporter CrcB [Pseudomonadota bacterium]ADU62826.1 CrcB protein [Pseudodesulfovibrio aespoeensis Aspo-2]MBU4245127.1 fluoride efflux transporter CrcB [Pseudomonadota bacterium]MBU4379725.1 fluoride efflux transporter CrcB [Pseudomonadota bacterium]MBU4474603.1 fluoride efflux transporter CrcB [Pseudomonadota bacterium]
MGMKILYLSLGGAAGTLSRYWLSGVAQRLAGTAFPLGTFMVNMAGCLFFGAVWGYFENRLLPGSGLRILALSGFMGAFTTFSTYMFETAELVKFGQYALALLNVVGQSLAGLALVLLGIALGRLL